MIYRLFRRNSALVALLAIVLAVAACSQDPATQPQLEGLAAMSALAPDAAALDLPSVVDSEEEYGNVDGPFDVLVSIGTARLKFSFKGKVQAKEIARIELRATSNDGGAVRGTVKVNFGDGSEPQQVDLRRRATLEHRYDEAGKYRITATLNDDTGYTGKANFRLNVGPARVYKVDAIWDGSVQPKVPESFGFNAYRNGFVDNSPTAAAAPACAIRGTLTVEFGDGSVETVENFGGSGTCYTTLNHTYARKGDYALKVILTLDVGTRHAEGYTVEVREKSEPPPPPPGSSEDAIDASQVVVVEPRAATDAFTWAQTRTISVSAFHEGSQRWSPDPAFPEMIIFGGPAQGILWIIRNVGGRYEASPVDWFLPGQTVQYLTQETMAGHSEFAWPGWAGPNFGETLWFMLSTPGWVGARGITNERTNIVEVRWGQ